MTRKPITSSHIKSIGWEANVLEIEFGDGSVFQYRNVPDAVWREFDSSPSKGRYLAMKIKGQFPASKVILEETDGQQPLS